MSANGSGRCCRTKAHKGRDLEIYESLPREVRDRLKIANSNLCAGCIRAKLKSYGLEEVLDDLDWSRRHERERRGREVWFVPVEDLKL